MAFQAPNGWIHFPFPHEGWHIGHRFSKETFSSPSVKTNAETENAVSLLAAFVGHIFKTGFFHTTFVVSYFIHGGEYPIWLCDLYWANFLVTCFLLMRLLKPKIKAHHMNWENPQAACRLTTFSPLLSDGPIPSLTFLPNSLIYLNGYFKISFSVASFSFFVRGELLAL